MVDSSSFSIPSSLLEVGPAVTISLLLSDWGRYSLTERIWYHFGLTDALIGSKEQAKQLATDKSNLNQQQRQEEQSNQESINENRKSSTIFKRPGVKTLKNEEVCGVVRLLECVPTKQWHRLTRREKRELKGSVRNFNLQALAARQKKDVFCHEPESLPIPLNLHSRVFFTYEVTRIAFCLDASPTLTSTFGFSGHGIDNHERACCPMDKLPGMARNFFASLIQPIPTPMSTTGQGFWQPILAVTVLAVYTRSSGMKPTNILVRDFRVTDADSAAVLCSRIAEWAFNVIECEIARSLSNPCYNDGENDEFSRSLFSAYDVGIIPMYNSSLQDLLHAGDAALMSLPSEGRPCIVIATDCQSISTDGVVDIVSDTSRIDTPLIVLDLSSSDSHTVSGTNQHDTENLGAMGFERNGCMFPLHVSDDSEALYNICIATGGCFFDSRLLDEARNTNAGLVGPDSPLSGDIFFAFKRHSFQPNAVQWYTIFTLSQLSQAKESTTMGKLIAPEYIRSRNTMQDNLFSVRKPESTSTITSTFGNSRFDLSNNTRFGHQSSISSSFVTSDSILTRKPQDRTSFATYIINPIRIHGILLMRVKEGYRAKQYGHSSNEPDRFRIQMILPLDLGIVVHYELSYKALPSELWIGFAHIKIELSGDVGFISMLKHDFVHQSAHTGQSTVTQQISNKICRLLRRISKEDMLHSHLAPLMWTDQMSSPDTPFIRRLHSLSDKQRQRHFRCDEFDCVCTSKLPWTHDDDFLREFKNISDGEQELFDAISEWSTQTIEKSKRYVKQTQAVGGLASYCVIELKTSQLAPRLFTVRVETFGGNGSGTRHSILASLKAMIDEIKDLIVLPKQLGQFLVQSRTVNRKEKLKQSQLNHATWDLVKDIELLPLLMRRRGEIGKFLLLDSRDDRATFAKLTFTANDSSIKIYDPGDLVQYQLAVFDAKVVVDVHMECEGGVFFPSSRGKLSTANSTTKAANVSKSKFQSLVVALKKRDQECGHALYCRTTLLRVFDEKRQKIVPYESDETPLSCVKRLIQYASKMLIKLRFFRSDTGSANEILESLTEETLLAKSIHAMNVSKLPIPSDASIDDLHGGSWFVMRLDEETLSMVHFSQALQNTSSELDGKRFSYRQITFYTVAITDLYNKRDDFADDASDDGHVSEHLLVSKFCDSFLEAHKRNYSAAAYLSLKQDGGEVKTSFALDDFSEVMRPLKFTEVASVVVGGDSRVDRKGDSTKLLKLLGSVLHSIENHEFYTFYDNPRHNRPRFDQYEEDSEASVNESSSAGLSNFEYEETIPHKGALREEADQDDESLGQDSAVQNNQALSLVSPPLFVRFQLDGKPVPISDLSHVRENSIVSVLLSTFVAKCDNRKVEGSNLPFSHLNAAFDLAELLNAFVAEQTLERLRHNGSAIWQEENDVRLVKSCLRKARNVVTSLIDVCFYIGKIDKIVAASAPAGTNFEVDEGFNLLYSELLNHVRLSLKSYGHGDSYLVDRLEEDGATISFWCLVNVKRAQGAIAVKIHHPGGAKQASELMDAVMEDVSSCCHRVNQHLLLRRLHQTRSASRLLILPDPDFISSKKEGIEEEESPFHDGFFECPIVYRTSFELFHRYATNPAQIARSLAATALHSFAVANRKQVFVYKDESGSVFYMALSASGGGAEADGRIELLVHGLNYPGHSITNQLRRLLQRRLHVIAVDTLSFVLTKNPHYSWRQADIRFVQKFETVWHDLDLETPKDFCPSARVYQFPELAYDPGMILVYLRQNLCGSTFFHRFVSSEWAADDSDKEEAPCHEPTLRLNPTDLLFYYNNAPSQLDPQFQPQSTLTEKGKQFSQEVGSGIAIVELTLMDSKGRKMRQLNAANKPSIIESELSISKSSLQFREVQNEENPVENNDSESVFVKVKITDTGLKRDIIHNWILLSLNQVLISWTIERLLERKQRGLFLPISTKTFRTGSSIKVRQKYVIDRISQGLPALIDCLEVGEMLPHPAIRKAHEFGIIRSSSVSTLSIEILEKCIFEQLTSEAKGKITFDNKLCVVIRSNRSLKPRQVQLKWDKNKNKCVVVHENDTICSDSPIDCPEYTIFYCFPEYETRNTGVNPFPKLFEEVSVGDDRNADISDFKSLQSVKDRNYFACRRSFAFIVSVKKNRRTLLAYNWSPLLFKLVASRLKELDSSYVMAAGLAVDQIQKYVLKDDAPVQTTKEDTTVEKLGLGNSTLASSSTNLKEIVTTPENADIDNNDEGLRRVARPLTIRKPKLIGKSVEGAAAHAVAASRARASANRFKSNQPSGTSTSTSMKTSEEGHADRPASKNRENPIPKPKAATGRSKEDEDAQDRAKNAFFSIIRRDTLLRPCTVASVATHFMIQSLWPLKENNNWQQTGSSGLFLLSRTQLSWIDASQMLPISAGLLQSFLPSFGNFLSQLLKVHMIPMKQSEDEILLLGRPRNVRAFKCFIVIRVSTRLLKINYQSKTIITAEGSILSIQRFKGGKWKFSPYSNTLMEKDSAGADKLSVEFRMLFRDLDGLLFDHVCQISEVSMKSVDGILQYHEVIKMLLDLLRFFPLPKMMSMRSQYKIFESYVTIRSYKDKLLDKYNGPRLLSFLVSNCSARRIVACGPSAICFKQEISVKGMQSICFLTCNEKFPDKILVVLLCRTQGKHLELMMREECKMVISVKDSITLQAASMAYDELTYAAMRLRRLELWKLLSATTTPIENPTCATIVELLGLCLVRPIETLLENSDDCERVEAIYKNGLLDLHRCFECMGKQTCFSPSWTVINDNEASIDALFYVRNEDIFVLFRKNVVGSDLQIYLILFEETQSTLERAPLVIQKVTNFLLHFMWTELMVQ